MDNENKNPKNYKIVICIFGCITIEKYKKQIQKIQETYEKQCNEDVKILYFLSETTVENYSAENFVYLKNVCDDYLSASYKQQFGLKHIYDNYDADFVLCCGTDTFINIPKLLRFTEKFDKNKNLYIGGHGCHRQIGDKSYYFHSGGPGFVISNECVKQLYPYLNDLTDKWMDVCYENNVEYLNAACDVAISYYLQKYKNVEIVKTGDLSFIHCNHRGFPCHPNEVNMNEIICCHSMSLNDFDEFNQILISNNHFLP